MHTAVNYGLDYAIYQTLPALCHSALSVLVIDGAHEREGLLSATGGGGGDGGGDGQGAEEGEGQGGEETLRWTHMAAMTRVMGVCTYS